MIRRHAPALLAVLTLVAAAAPAGAQRVHVDATPTVKHALTMLWVHGEVRCLVGEVRADTVRLTAAPSPDPLCPDGTIGVAWPHRAGPGSPCAFNRAEAEAIRRIRAIVFIAVCWPGRAEIHVKRLDPPRAGRAITGSVP